MIIKRKDFEIYEQIILSEQIDHDEIVHLLDENLDFSNWYRERARNRRIRMQQESLAGNDNQG